MKHFMDDKIQKQNKRYPYGQREEIIKRSVDDVSISANNIEYIKSKIQTQQEGQSLLD
jgi:hypothetical protein